MFPGESGNPRDPFVSPSYAGLAGLPRCYIQAFSGETGLEDSRLFADRARQAGADVRVDPFLGQQHTFQMAAGGSKDADEAMRRLADLAHPKLVRSRVAAELRTPGGIGGRSRNARGRVTHRPLVARSDRQPCKRAGQQIRCPPWR
jgi:hypothetical protein